MNLTTRYSLFLMAAYLSTFVLNYGFSVALSWLLPPAEFGVLGVAQSLLLLAGLAVGAGFAWTAAHDLAASGATEETRQRFRAAWLANSLLGLALAGGLWAAYALGWLSLGPAYRTVVPLVGLTTAVLASRAVVNGAARGLYRFNALAVNLAGEVVVKIIVGLALVLVGWTVPGVMLGFVVGALAAQLHSLWIVRPARLWQGRGGWFDRQVLRTTVPLFVGMLGPALMLNLDLLGLKLLAAPDRADELVGFYQAASILARMPVFIAQALILVLFSFVAGAQQGAQEGTPQDYLRMVLRAWFRLLLPVGLVLLLAPRAVLTLFFPAHYVGVEGVLQLAAGGGLMLALVTLLTGVFQATPERRGPALAAGAAVVVQLIVLAWFVPRWGISGAAFSLIVASAAALLGLAPLLMARLGLRLSGGGRSLALLSLGKAALPPLVLAGVLLLLPGQGRGMALLKLLLAGLGYLLALGAIYLRPAPGAERRLDRTILRLIQVLMGV